MNIEATCMICKTEVGIKITEAILGVPIQLEVANCIKCREGLMSKVAALMVANGQLKQQIAEQNEIIAALNEDLSDEEG